MALKGDLTSVPLGDVIQTLFQNEKDGTLKLRGDDFEKSIYCCPKGITLLEPEILNRRRFGDIVVAAKVCTRLELEKALRGNAEDLPVGQVLVNAGIMDQEMVDLILKIQVEEEIFDLFNLSNGEFEFFENEGNSSVKANGLPLFQVNGMVFEAARRMDEWALIHEYSGDLDSVFVRIEGKEPPDGHDAKKIFKCIDGRSTLQNISDQLIASPFEVAKTVASLARDGLVRLADKHELLALAQDLIDGDEIAAAGTILKKLRPNLNNVILGEEDVSSLANLFYKVGDILTATNLLLNRVKESKKASLHSDSLTFLKQAHRIAPQDIRILKELAQA
ncbi:MAG: DUF4388 domain-containing protein, partial [Planctomycetes bacterium]|nr:DUF4388 domain-containing protein [Planctomycetota bacterium]